MNKPTQKTNNMTTIADSSSGAKLDEVASKLAAQLNPTPTATPAGDAIAAALNPTADVGGIPGTVEIDGAALSREKPEIHAPEIPVFRGAPPPAEQLHPSDSAVKQPGLIRRMFAGVAKFLAWVLCTPGRWTCRAVAAGFGYKGKTGEYKVPALHAVVSAVIFMAMTAAIAAAMASQPAKPQELRLSTGGKLEGAGWLSQFVFDHDGHKAVKVNIEKGNVTQQLIDGKGRTYAPTSGGWKRL